MSISDQLRAAIEADERTYRGLAADAGISHVQILRFVGGREIRNSAIDWLCEALSLELREIE